MQFEPFLGLSEESECGMSMWDCPFMSIFWWKVQSVFFVMVELWLEFIQDNVKFVLCTSAALTKLGDRQIFKHYPNLASFKYFFLN